MQTALKILILLAAYLFGAIPFGFIIGKIKGVDIRDYGSKNIGSTNVGRVLGKKYAVLAYLLDMTKGGFFVFLFRFGIIPESYMIVTPLLYGLLAVIGHTCSVFLKFKGGKAVATSSGVIFGFCPWLLPLLIAIFYTIVLASSYVSLSSLLSAIITLIASLILYAIGYDPVFNLPINYYFPVFCLLIVLIIFYRHRENIDRLKRKTENKVNIKIFRKK
ncbi:MAG TPA: glycerol-3-phosphate 1-O-acyltransferase PlsY [Bacilli bacterium]